MTDDTKAVQEGLAPATPSDPEESFAAMFEASQGGRDERLRVGDKIRGAIISVGPADVFVDTGAKVDGVVDKAELTSPEGEFPYKEGDTLELYVVSITRDEVRLSRAMSGQGGMELAREAYESQVPVQGKVREAVKGGFSVEVMHRRTFCPMSQMDARPVADPAAFVGETFDFLITRFEENGRNIVVSRRTLLERENEKSRAEYLSTVKPGDDVDGRVVRIMPFGAFVELVPGVEGMVHVSEISWSRVADPSEAVSVGDTIRVKILSVAEGDKPGRMKISLSAKKAQGDPWAVAPEQFKAGQKVTGKVTRLADFGAFVELSPGIEGLVHLSEMSYAKRVVKASDVVAQGETVSVTIKDVDPTKRRISLSLREAMGDPWLEAAEKYKPGQSVTGTMEKRENFGLFVALEPGVTGLLPKSNMAKSAKPAEFDQLKPGDQVTLVVENVNSKDRRISLAPADMQDTDEWRGYTPPAPKAQAGSLAEKLAQALAAKTGK